jgi:hypothetical protein
LTAVLLHQGLFRKLAAVVVDRLQQDRARVAPGLESLERPEQVTAEQLA